MLKSRALFAVAAICFLLVGPWMIGCGDDDDDNNDEAPDDDTDDDVNDDADDDVNDDLDDDTEVYEGTHLLPGPNEEGYDALLEEKADRHDRQHLLFNCAGNGASSDVNISLANEADRQLVEDFLQTTDSWDFETFSGGRTPLDVLTTHEKVAGLYGGVGIAADAFRYGVFRDQGYPQEDIDRAKAFLLRSIEGLFVAAEITGVEGVIARGFCRTDIPGACNPETTPLFDEFGDPLPAEKDNGTWREDNSADNRFANYKWEDSCSRDMIIGWATAFGAVWEVIRDDPEFDEATKDKIQLLAGQIGRSLMVERTGGPGSLGQAFDLEIFDADGRTTFHGYLNENAFDRFYVAWLPLKDGFYAMMSLGIVAALTYVSEDPVLEDYFYTELIGERHFADIVYNQVVGFNLGYISNFSGTNMAYAGALLALRYITDLEAREKVAYATETHMYFNKPPLLSRQPVDYSYSLYDFIYATAVSGESSYNEMTGPPDADAVARGVQTLLDFAQPPYWDVELINCDGAEMESGDCTLNDGSHCTYLGEVGRKGTPICEEPVPHAVRPPSNYHWRSCPYRPNSEGGGGPRLIPGVDFRIAYWYGRWVK
jgi:hypothetical protein